MNAHPVTAVTYAPLLGKHLWAERPAMVEEIEAGLPELIAHHGQVVLVIDQAPGFSVIILLDTGERILIERHTAALWRMAVIDDSVRYPERLMQQLQSAIGPIKE